MVIETLEEGILLTEFLIMPILALTALLGGIIGVSHELIMEGERDVIGSYPVEEELLVVDILALFEDSSDDVPEGVGDNGVNMLELEYFLEFLHFSSLHFEGFVDVAFDFRHFHVFG